MVLLCVECDNLYKDTRFNKGHYGVCEKCDKKLVDATPEFLFKKLAKIFEHEPSRYDVKELINVGLRELRKIKPIGQPQNNPNRGPKSKRIDLGLKGY